MKVVALMSGGKDSCYSAMKCVEHGHEIVAIANLYPSHEESQRDSYMYQTQGWEMLPAIARCMGVPLERRAIVGTSLNQDLLYENNAAAVGGEDEVEDMFLLLQAVKEKYPEVNAVCSGAVLSTYQRSRVENVCERLGLTSLAYLWQRDQKELLEEMIQMGEMHAVLVKVCSFGLDAKHLGRSIADLQEEFLRLEAKCGMHVCGEGGEYETLTLDCPLFTQGRIVLDETEAITLKHIPSSPICVLNILRYHVEPKPALPMPSQAQTASAQPPPAAAALNQVLLPGLDIFSTASSPWLLGPFSSPSSITEAMDAFEEALGQRLAQVCIVHLYLQNLDDFAEVNVHFGKLFKTTHERQPPARVTLELQTKHRISILALVNGRTQTRPQILQVRSRSEWAPMCIGPYSQASVLEERLVLVSGQIPLVPESMQLLQGEDLLPALTLCFQHCTRVSKQLRGNFSQIALVYCSTQRNGKEKEAGALLSQAASALTLMAKKRQLPCSTVVLLAVPRLPREALVEVEFVASVGKGDAIMSTTTMDACTDKGDCVWTRVFTTKPSTFANAICLPVQAVGVLQAGELAFHDALPVSISLAKVSPPEEDSDD